MRAPWLVAIGILTSACDRPAPPKAAATAETPRPAPAGVQEARALTERGQLDEALAVLDASGGDADILAAIGAVWVKKAEAAPLPTPPPLASPAPKRATPPPAPEFKPEELTALGFLDRALQAKPGHPAASLALAELLGPHAARRFDRDKAGAHKPERGRPAAPLAVEEGGPDHGVARVVNAYKAAAAGPPVSREVLEKMYVFAVRVERLDEAQWTLEELGKLDKEKPEPLIRYGDFLRDVKKDPHAAIERYREALMWRPDDEATLGKIADIYIGEGIEAYGKNHWAVAQARLTEAQKFVRNPNSPQGLRIRDYQGRLATIRQSPTR